MVDFKRARSKRKPSTDIRLREMQLGRRAWREGADRALDLYRGNSADGVSAREPLKICDRFARQRQVMNLCVRVHFRLAGVIDWPEKRESLALTTRRRLRACIRALHNKEPHVVTVVLGRDRRVAKMRIEQR